MDKLTQRRIRFLEALEARQSISAAEAAALFALSEATVRRMFAAMERDGLLIRTRGGARRAPEAPLFPDTHPGAEGHTMAGSHPMTGVHPMAGSQTLAGCQTMAAAAAEWVADHDIIYLEAGPAQHHLARSLAARLFRGQLRDITVVTNSMELLRSLSPACRVVLIGGEYRPGRRGFAGWASEMMLSQYRFQKCFLGADGVDPDAGFMAADLETAHQNALVLSHSECAAVLLEPEKFTRRSLVAFAPFDTVACVVTGPAEPGPPHPLRAALERRGIRILCE